MCSGSWQHNDSRLLSSLLTATAPSRRSSTAYWISSPNPSAKRASQRHWTGLSDDHPVLSILRSFSPSGPASVPALFPLDEVIYCKGARAYSEIHFRDGTIELHDKPLVQLCKILPPVFEHIHKSYVVNMTEVSDVLVSSGTKYELVLKDGEKLPVGRTRYAKVREKWFG